MCHAKCFHGQVQPIFRRIVIYVPPNPTDKKEENISYFLITMQSVYQKLTYQVMFSYFKYPWLPYSTDVFLTRSYSKEHFCLRCVQSAVVVEFCIGFRVPQIVWFSSWDITCSLIRAMNFVWCSFFVLWEPLHTALYHWHHVVVASQQAHNQ